MKPEILFENDDFIALNKPAGLLSIPDREGKEVSLKTMLQEKYGQIFTVHRLDRGTSGVIIFAKNEESHRYFSVAFEDRSVEKFYTGIVQGVPTEKKKSIEAGIMENPAKRGQMIIHSKGKASHTDYEVVEDLGKFALVNFQIHTGRTHQIRVHMQNEGHPILCDELYGDPKPILLSTFKKNFKLSKKEDEERPLLNRMALHAAKLILPLPDGKKLTLEAPLPKDLMAFLNQIRKLKKKVQ
ncbi:MAG: RluA family pseudouridine synthase [Chitinophagaceae bacterium]|nr:RluA family pseudouridine synthase [Chitinophagaceae bacterium]